MTHVNPTRDQLEGMLTDLSMDKPVTMLNLLRFHDQANYGTDGDHAPCTGVEAYGRYGDETRAILAQIGAEIIWNGKPAGVLIGPKDEQWDQAFLVRYPSGGTFFRMLSLPEYQAATVHRTAALRDSRLIATQDGTRGSSVGKGGRASSLPD